MPPKPKGMHLDSYERLWLRLRAAESEWSEHVNQLLQHTTARVGARLTSARVPTGTPSLASELRDALEQLRGEPSQQGNSKKPPRHQ